MTKNMILGEFKSAGIGWENAERVEQNRAICGTLLTPSVLLGTKHLSKSSDLIEVVLIRNNNGVSYRKK